MNFRHDPSDTAFRNEVREFLSQHLPHDMAERCSHGYHPLKEDLQAWAAVLHRKGWSAPAWPREHGGAGWSVVKQYIFETECLLAGAPLLHTQGLSIVGPTIYTFGDAAQQQKYLPKIRSGEELWALGFSEPNAGSDLVALRTRAQRQGDHYVINGRKIWTSDAHIADHIILFARTDPQAPPQHGISIFLVAVDTPGITVRPIISIDEAHSLNETTYDDVRVPIQCRVGEENKGWSYAKFVLENERVFAAEAPMNRRNFERLRLIAARQTIRGRPLIEDESFSRRMAVAEADLYALEFMTLRALVSKQQYNERAPIGSVMKIRGTELMQHISELTMEALGDYAAPFYPASRLAGVDYPPGPDYAPGVSSDFFYRRAATIYGGTNEIQRNIIARHFLEL